MAIVPSVVEVFGGLNNTSNGADITHTLTGAVENDIILTVGGHSNRATFVPGPSTAGYTSIYNNVAASPFFDISWKRMGVSPDATVVCKGTGNAVDSTAYCAYIISGCIRSGSPLHGSVITQGPTASSNPICPAITTTIDRCLIMAVAISTVQDAITIQPATFQYYGNYAANDTGEDVTASISSRVQAVAGLIDPGAWTGWASGTWIGATFAFLPASAIVGKSTIIQNIGTY